MWEEQPCACHWKQEGPLQVVGRGVYPSIPRLQVAPWVQGGRKPGSVVGGGAWPELTCFLLLKQGGSPAQVLQQRQGHCHHQQVVSWETGDRGESSWEKKQVHLSFVLSASVLPILPSPHLTDKELAQKGVTQPLSSGASGLEPRPETWLTSPGEGLCGEERPGSQRLALLRLHLAEVEVTLHKCPKNPFCIVKNARGNCQPEGSVCLGRARSAAQVTAPCGSVTTHAGVPTHQRSPP